MHDVYEALRLIRHGELRSGFTTSFFTLVIMEDDPAVAATAAATAVELARLHPSRSVLVRRGRPSAPHRLEASVNLFAVPHGNHPVSFDQVHLFIEGPLVDRLESVVLPLTTSDVPTILWSPTSIPRLDDPLLTLADRVIVDSKTLGGSACFSTLLGLDAAAPVTDLAWNQLRPWREMLADLFEARPWRPFLGNVEQVSVAGAPGARELLLGWLVSRLNLPAEVARWTDAPHIAINLVARSAGKVGHFSVASSCRKNDGHLARVTAQIEDSPRFEQMTAVPDSAPEHWLGDAICGSRDHCYKEAAGAASAGLSDWTDRRCA